MDDNERDQFAMILKERNDFAAKSKSLTVKVAELEEKLDEAKTDKEILVELPKWARGEG